MSNGLLKPVWVAATQRFHDRDTGRFISLADAVSSITVRGGAFRDAMGRYIPKSFMGGDVVTQSPMGAPSVTQIVRDLPVEPSDFSTRPRDTWVASYTYRYQGGEEKSGVASLRKGLDWNPIDADEQMSRYIAREEEGGSDQPVDYWNDVEVVEVKWQLRSMYAPGEALGEDYFHFSTL